MTSARLTLWVLLLSPLPARAAGAPVVVQQSSAHNTSTVIQARSSVVNIAHSRTVTQGSATVTEVVAIGPDPVPVVVAQFGVNNRAVTFQQGRDPKLTLRQSGGIDVATTVQNEIP